MHRYLPSCCGVKCNSLLLRALSDARGVSVIRIDSSTDQISSKGLAQLLRVLRRNICSAYFNLSHNNFENDEIIYIVTVLSTENGASLRFLTFSNNPVSLAVGRHDFATCSCETTASVWPAEECFCSTAIGLKHW